MSDLLVSLLNEVNLFQVAYPNLKPWLLQSSFLHANSMPFLF